MAKSKSNGEITTTRIDKRVAQFVAIRKQIEDIKEAHKLELAPFNEAKDKLVNAMLTFLDETGQKSAKTVEGTVSIKVTHTSPLSDPDAFMEFVRENDQWVLLERRANATACIDYAEEHDGILPPGVKINANRTVGVTKA